MSRSVKILNWGKETEKRGHVPFHLHLLLFSSNDYCETFQSFVWRLFYFVWGISVVLWERMVKTDHMILLKSLRVSTALMTEIHIFNMPAWADSLVLASPLTLASAIWCSFSFTSGTHFWQIKELDGKSDTS